MIRIYCDYCEGLLAELMPDAIFLEIRVCRDCCVRKNLPIPSEALRRRIDEPE